NGHSIHRFDAFRGALTPPTTENDKIKSDVTYRVDGQLHIINNPAGGNDSTSAGSSTTIGYEPDDAPDYKRSLPNSITSGVLNTTIDRPDKNTVIALAPRGVITTTTSDAYGRPVHVTTSGPDVNTDEQYFYDKNGRLHQIIRRQHGKDISTTYGYDLMGR